MNEVVLKYLKKQGYDNVSTNYYKWIDLWESWWRNEVDFHKYRDDSGVERTMYTLGMAKRMSEDWASILFTERDEVITEANTTEQTERNNEYLDKQLKVLKVYKDLPTAIEKAMATGTAGAILRIKHAKVDKQGGLFSDERTKTDIIYVSASQIIPLRVEHGEIIDIAKDILNKFLIIAPFLLIIFVSFDLLRIVTMGSPDDSKKAKQNIVKRVIAFLLLLLVPSIVHFITSIEVFNNDEFE